MQYIICNSNHNYAKTAKYRFCIFKFIVDFAILAAFLQYFLLKHHTFSNTQRGVFSLRDNLQVFHTQRGLSCLRDHVQVNLVPKVGVGRAFDSGFSFSPSFRLQLQFQFQPQLQLLPQPQLQAQLQPHSRPQLLPPPFPC